MDPDKASVRDTRLSFSLLMTAPNMIKVLVLSHVANRLIRYRTMSRKRILTALICSIAAL